MSKSEREVLADAFETCRLAIEASLPKLAEYLRFSPDKKSGGLRVESAVEGRLKFTQAEVAEITAAVEFKGGNIVTTKAGYYWLVLREALLSPPKASVASVPVGGSNGAAQKVSEPALASTESAPLAQSVPKQAEANPASPSVAVKQPEVAKMPSPPALFVAQNCARCVCLEKCHGDVNARLRCLEVLKLNALRDCASEFCGLNENLRTLIEFLKARPYPQQQSMPVQQQAASANSSQQPPSQQSSPTPQSTSTPVQRNTRPTTGYKDNSSGVVWVKAQNDKGEYEKATEADNQGNDKFYEAVDWIREHSDKPFLDGFFYWVFDEPPLTIGRKLCKRGRRGY